MTIFWRQRFLEVLFIFFCLKFIALLLQIFGIFIVTTNAFNNVELTQNWMMILNFVPSNFHIFIFDIMMSLLSIIFSYIWLNKLVSAKKKRFKRFPGNLAFFAIFIVFFSLSSHWIFSLTLLALFILAKRKRKITPRKVQNVSYS